MATDRPDVAVSLVNTDNRELLECCLRSIPLACSGLSWQATVVDNASADGSREMIRELFTWARLVENDRRLGFSANHNQVIEPVLWEESARYVLILNEDTELDPQTVTKLVEFADARPWIGAVGPAIYGNDGEIQPSYFGFPTMPGTLRAMLRPGATPRRPKGQGWLNGSCILARVDALREVGTLDERFFIFYEDTDLCRRLWDGGWEVALHDEARILHHGHQTVSQPVLGSVMEKQMLRSRYLYLEKHHGPRTAQVATRANQVALMLRAAKAWGEGPRAAGDERRKAQLLAALARYEPRNKLGHE
jgi:GT2 family glycosyltransferase